MTYFPAMQYHRRSGLNFCVRDGNRCDPRPVVTDNPLAAPLGPASSAKTVDGRIRPVKGTKRKPRRERRDRADAGQRPTTIPTTPTPRTDPGPVEQAGATRAAAECATRTC